MSTLKVGGIRGVSASSDAITVANDGTCTANITNNLSNRNKIINGAMLVAQRGTSSTSSSYQTVDRFKHSGSGWDNPLTQAQGDVAGGTTPYTQGFRKTFKLTNGNQSSGAGAGDSLSMSYIVEDQDLATSGWNYLSSSAYITLSFWFKSSINQTFYVILESKDGTSRQYSFAITPTDADTWTKVTHSIPGNSGLQFSNDNGEGIEIYFALFYGTNLTTSGHTLNTWKTTSSSDQCPDMTSTWFTTNNATFEITGVQLEVGSVATDFEHRKYCEEALLCKRYYQVIKGNSDLVMFGSGRASGTTAALVATQLAVPLRASPTLPSLGYSTWGVAGSHSVTATPSVQSFNATDNQLNMQFGSTASLTNARTACVACHSGSNLTMDAEL